MIDKTLKLHVMEVLDTVHNDAISKVPKKVIRPITVLVHDSEATMQELQDIIDERQQRLSLVTNVVSTPLIVVKERELAIEFSTEQETTQEQQQKHVANYFNSHAFPAVYKLLVKKFNHRRACVSSKDMSPFENTTLYEMYQTDRNRLFDYFDPFFNLATEIHSF